MTKLTACITPDEMVIANKSKIQFGSKTSEVIYGKVKDVECEQQ